MKYIKIILVAIVLLLLVVFAHYNQTPTSLVFLSYEGVTYQSFKLPLFAFFYIAILITIIVMSLLEVIERTSLRIKNRRLQKENAKLSAEMDTLRQAALPPPVKPVKPVKPGEPAGTSATEAVPGKKAPAAKKKK